MILDFFNTTANLKVIPRQGWIDKLGIKKPESVADHVFSMAIMGMVFSDLKNYNTEKILKIILLHDLAESLTGDITPEQITKKEKIKSENNAMKTILSKLPRLLQKQYSDLWSEFQDNDSKEAKLVHQIDKLEMALQAKIYSKNFSSKKSEIFIESAKAQIKDSKFLELLTKISNQ